MSDHEAENIRWWMNLSELETWKVIEKNGDEREIEDKLIWTKL